MVRFLEKNGYDVSYISGVDTDRSGGLLLNHKVFLSVGHDEYWSGAQRTNVAAARDAGVNLQFLSGNEMYWRTRYEPSAVDGAAYRTIVSYKETWANGKIDPSTEWTGTWRDPRYRRAGQWRRHAGERPDRDHVHVQLHGSAHHRQRRGRQIPALAQHLPGHPRCRDLGSQLAPHTVGYESNEDVDNGFRPAGLIRLSTTNRGGAAVPAGLRQHRQQPETTTHN